MSRRWQRSGRATGGGRSEPQTTCRPDPGREVRSATSPRRRAQGLRTSLPPPLPAAAAAHCAPRQKHAQHSTAETLVPRKVTSPPGCHTVGPETGPFRSFGPCSLGLVAHAATASHVDTRPAGGRLRGAGVAAQIKQHASRQSWADCVGNSGLAVAVDGWVAVTYRTPAVSMVFFCGTTFMVGNHAGWGQLRPCSAPGCLCLEMGATDFFDLPDGRTVYVQNFAFQAMFIPIFTEATFLVLNGDDPLASSCDCVDPIAIRVRPD
eukprot:scaffold7233_cov570-Prasinococcus_capsulatus_cf.AAC.5